MMQLDERIMEYIDREGWVSPRLLARERGFPETEGVIRDRCKRLRYTGFIEPFHGEMYDITIEGQLYLDGEIDARHQPFPKASAVFGRWDFPPGWTPGPVRFRI
ncbi:hypothetical protein C475_17798 [Halosimplex carlsbadense 2-9-1]|uniref:Uncharacterized protein n=2 Tax=Halosimplex carlsbadense TaxID=171164 RepID=M0CGI4_9EURY|nr:hypothetical protein C475_17798 [Halosimplex carlsbadense 2-9-1]